MQVFASEGGGVQVYVSEGEVQVLMGEWGVQVHVS